MLRNLNSNTAKNKEYLDSGSWKCDKSPSGAHHWIISQNQHDMQVLQRKPTGLGVTQFENPTFIATS